MNKIIIENRSHVPPTPYTRPLIPTPYTSLYLPYTLCTSDPLYHYTRPLIPIDETPDIEGLNVVKVCEFDEDVEQAAEIRENLIIPWLENDELVVLDFSGIRAATQSFAHALMYKLFRDIPVIQSCLTISCADNASVQAVKAVAAYAAVSASNRYG